MNLKYIISLAFICFTRSLFADNQSSEILVSNSSELNAAIASAIPGQTIVMKDGIWKNLAISFNSKANATATVKLRAQTAGKVFLSGNSTLTFSAPFLVVDGLVFKNGSIENGSVISFNSDNCRLTNTIIKDYNPTDFQTAYYWVFFSGS